MPGPRPAGEASEANIHLRFSVSATLREPAPGAPATTASSKAPSAWASAGSETAAAMQPSQGRLESAAEDFWRSRASEASREASLRMGPTVLAGSQREDPQAASARAQGPRMLTKL